MIVRLLRLRSFSGKGISFRAPVAQLDRASGFGPEGHLFESGRVRQITNTIKKNFLIRQPSSKVLLIKASKQNSNTQNLSK